MKGILFDGRKIPEKFHYEFKFGNTRITQWNITYVKPDSNGSQRVEMIPLHLDDYKYAVHDQMIDFEIVDSGHSSLVSVDVKGGIMDATYIVNSNGPKSSDTVLHVGKITSPLHKRIKLLYNHFVTENPEVLKTSIISVAAVVALILLIKLYSTIK